VLPPRIDTIAPVGTQGAPANATHLAGNTSVPWKRIPTDTVTGTMTLSWNLNR
jgi:hypothetical protein